MTLLADVKISISMCSKNCHTHDCPFAFTNESEQIQNYGCLPTPYDILVMRLVYGKTWACHSDPRKPCLGALLYLKERELEFKVIDPVLLTEKSDWHLFIEPNDKQKFYELLQSADKKRLHRLYGTN